MSEDSPGARHTFKLIMLLVKLKTHKWVNGRFTIARFKDYAMRHERSKREHSQTP